MNPGTACALALSIVTLVLTAPFTLAGPTDEPEDQHEQARELCERADPLEHLTFAAARIDRTPAFVPPVPRNADFTTAILQAYASLHFPTSPADVLHIQTAANQFAPEAREPLAMLLQAWATATALSNAAIKSLTHAEVAFMLDNPDHERTIQLSSKIDTRLQVAAAQHLLETEHAARPLLEKAVDNGAFPETPVIADPRGYIYIGGTGDNVDDKTRYFLFDPAGNDQYWARVVGATPLAENIVPGVFTPDPLSPAAFGLELDGDDHYDSTAWYLRHGDTYGGSRIGVAVMIEANGNDSFNGAGRSMGSASSGIGIFLDETGNDYHRGPDILGQSSVDSIAIAIDREGNDINIIRGAGQGYAQNGARSFAAFCDVQGEDSHGNTRKDTVLGMAFDADSTAWFTDLGGDVDDYVLFGQFEKSPAADSSTWTYGDFGGTGYGQDI